MAATSARAGSRETIASPPVAQFRFAASSVVAAIAVAAVYFGRPILVPVALATLLAFALAPVVAQLRRLHLGRVPSVILTALLALAVIGGVGMFIGSQFAHVAADLPHYQHNIAGKIQSLRGSATANSLIGRTSSFLDGLDNNISTAPHDSRAADSTGLAIQTARRDTPVPVEIRKPAASPIELIEDVLEPLLQPLATTGIAIIFVVFILLQKEDLRDRFIWLAGSSDLQRAKAALDDGAARLSRYLLTQTAINTCFGILIGIGLWLIGVPNPVLWGLIAMIFRFVPYVGIPLAAMVPLVLALAVDPGWSLVFWVAGLYFGLESVTGQAIEPLLYGHSVGLSPVAVVVAATFWTWVWGPVGLLLSTPLTMCLVVLGRHVERLKFLDVLLGNRPPLANEETFYLRILAGDPDDAAHHAESFLKDHSLCEFYDVALKALVLAQLDVNRGALESNCRSSVKEMVEGLIQNLSDYEDIAADQQSPDACEASPARIFTPESLPTDWVGQPVLCVAGRGILDEAAGLLLVHLLEKRGIGARVISAPQASPANVQRIDPSGVQFICLSYLEAGSDTSAHYLMRRLRRRIPAAHAMTCFWGLAGENARYLDAVAATGCDVVTNLRDAADCIAAAVGQTPARFNPGAALSASKRTDSLVRAPEAPA